MTNKPIASERLVFAGSMSDAVVPRTHQLVLKRRQIVLFRELGLYWAQNYPVEYLSWYISLTNSTFHVQFTHLLPWRE